jgi:hypothetical protein
LREPRFREFKTFKSVVLPAPLEPIIANTSCGLAMPLTFNLSKYIY